ncbi:DENN domain-containing protein 11-like [Hydractinia symbiolongicarpus]|uniref:DENN domain-containing protein 11-like n=1 Tax=Hydractinia symbiolongicarpus TaxID=13093 RepID=UPI00254CC8D5|nr:DENN domain-containing protein 11-like [Hydractinia symbiolongicarpus]
MNNPNFQERAEGERVVPIANSDFIVAIFVVAFDTKRGNEVEWQIPDDVDIAGVEFKALVSGSHTISEDFVYFRHQQYYGLSCFALKSVDNEEERGARMKSVGIICTKYTSLHEHQEFLEKQVSHHLEQPRSYEDLTKYYVKYRNCPHQNNTFLVTPRNHTAEGFLGIEELTVMKISHPIGCFSQFLNYFGVNIFVLWKFVLLQKRILYFAPPPVGVQCYRVYCTGLLGSNGLGLLRSLCPNLLFCVGVSSCSSLSSMDSFVACTTESILATKPETYDLYLNKQTLQCPNEYLRTITHINSADSARFTRLRKYSNEQLISGGEVVEDEKMYTRFFIEQNNRLFKILYEISSREDRTLTVDHVHEMGLDPSGDRVFLTELADLYNIRVNFPDLSCCQ